MKYNWFICALVLLWSMSSCEKEEMESEQTTEQQMDAAESMSLADDEFTVISSWMVGDQSNTTGKEERVDMYGLPECAVVELTSGDNGHKMIIDFGQQGCEGRDGKVRKGKIITEWEGDWNTVGRTRTITLENYEVNGHAVKGKSVMTIEQVYSKEEGTNPKRRIQVMDASVATNYTDNDGNVKEVEIEWESDRMITHNLTGTLYDVRDDLWIVTGTAKGTSRRGLRYEAEITKPLVRSFECFYNSDIASFVDGKIMLTTENGKEVTIDYGEGACDVIAKVSSGDHEWEIRVNQLWKK